MVASTVGIDAMAFHGPECFVDMTELATARGVDPGKNTKGLGQLEMAVATPCEDTVSLATVAARKSLTAFDIDPQEIGTLIVGTETGVDHSKPVAVYVHELLGLPSNCRTFETKHACYGAMAGLTSAIDWIVAGRARGKKALIIASDIARYGAGTPGEPTQGAGAVAMVVSETPRLLSIDKEVFGDYTRQVMDFWRPLYSKYAFTDGHYSIDCYLEALSGAYRDWRGKAEAKEIVRRNSAALPSEQLAAVGYHVPFCKMAKKAHARLRRCDLDDVLGAFDEAREEREGATSFERQVAPSLTLCSRVGNIYTGSLYLGLAGMLHAGATELAGKRIALFSYGSGCASEFFSGVVGKNAAERIRRARLDEIIGSRERVTVEEYERLMALAPESPPDIPPRPGAYRFTGVTEHRRQYAGG
jgi:hydroxymethylglutaryl-CoA synthase